MNIDKYIAIEKELSEEYGPFNLFALFLREDSADKWDILVASNWLRQNKQKSISLIAKKLQEKLDKEELINISRIALIEDNNPALDAFQRTINIEHGNAEVKDRNFFGLQIKHAYIITSRRTNQNEPAHNKS